MPSAFAERARSVEQAPRRALLWGAGLLVLGLAAVGVGQPDEGAVLSLCGLLVTIYGIHRFGRLGPDDPDAGEDRPGETAPVDTMWKGGLVLLVGLTITGGGYFEAGSTGGSGRFLLAYVAVLGGAVALASGWLDLQKVRRVQAKVEKRRRLRKSRAP